MIELIVGFALGFVSGISYAREKPEPWQDLDSTVRKVGGDIQRAVKGGPTPPGGEQETKEQAIDAK